MEHVFASIFYVAASLTQSVKKLAQHSTKGSQAVRNTNCLLISRHQLEIVAAQEVQEFTALKQEELTISN